MTLGNTIETCTPYSQPLYTASATDSDSATRTKLNMLNFTEGQSKIRKCSDKQTTKYNVYVTLNFYLKFTKVNEEIIMQARTKFRLKTPVSRKSTSIFIGKFQIISLQNTPHFVSKSAIDI